MNTTHKTETAPARQKSGLTIETYTAPSAWASYLINGDFSGLDEADLEAARAFVQWVGSDPVSCEDAGFRNTHDAWQFCPLSADCQTYTFLRKA